MRDTDNKIKIIKQEMNSQDKRWTAWPIFIVQVEKKICTLDGAHDDYQYLNSEGDEMDKRTLCKYCKDYTQGYTNCDKCDCMCVVPYRSEWVWHDRAGFFFTAKACNAHIKANRHHYGRSARSYAISACHNSELQTVMEYLSGTNLA